MLTYTVRQTMTVADDVKRTLGLIMLTEEFLQFLNFEIVQLSVASVQLVEQRIFHEIRGDQID